MERLFTLPNGRRIRLVEGDITKIPVDAIANAANSGLIGGGGVDGAIHRAGGPEIMRELNAIRPSVAPLLPGRAVATGAGRLPAKFVFHTAGPVWRGGKYAEPQALASSYHDCMRLAAEHGCRTISFPSISTGVYGFPLEPAAQIAIGTILALLRGDSGSVEEVVFVQYGDAAYRLYEPLLADACAEHGEHGG